MRIGDEHNSGSNGEGSDDDREDGRGVDSVCTVGMGGWRTIAKPPSDTPWGSAESPHSAAVEAKLQEGM